MDSNSDDSYSHWETEQIVGEGENYHIDPIGFGTQDFDWLFNIYK